LLGRLLAFRISANLAINNEHYARSYCDALAHLGEREQGLEWLEHRARKYGAKSLGAASWVTWAAALEHWGEPDRALKACDEAGCLHPQSPELQNYLAFFLVRLGKWGEANSSVKALQSLGNAVLHEEAAAMVARLSGNLDDAIGHCESW